MRVTGVTGVGNNLVRYYPILKLDPTCFKTEDTVALWSAISTLIEKHLDCKKGFRLPGIGIFTYITKNLSLGKGVTQVTLKPIFIISDKLAVKYWLRRPNVYFEEVVPSVTLNFYVLANFLAYDFTKMRLCYSKIIEKLEHYVLIRRSFVIPFPGIGKLIFEGTAYRFKFNSGFLATHKVVQTKRGETLTPPIHATCVCDLLLSGNPLENDEISKLMKKPKNEMKQDIVRRSMNTAKQIRNQYNNPSFDPSVIPPPRDPYTTIPPRPLPEWPQPRQFRISYPKPCMGLTNCGPSKICTVRQHPESLFMKDFMKARRNYLGENCVGTCEPPISQIIYPVITSPKIDNLYRLKAGQDKKVEEDQKSCVRKTAEEILMESHLRKIDGSPESNKLICANCQSRAHREYDRIWREEKNYNERWKENMHNLYTERRRLKYLAEVEEQKRFKAEIQKSAMEYDDLNRDYKWKLHKNLTPENDFSNQYIFSKRPQSPTLNRRLSFDKFAQMDLICRASKRKLEEEAKEDEESELRSYMSKTLERKIKREKAIDRWIKAEQKYFLKLQGSPKQWRDPEGEYFIMPEESKNKYFEYTRNRMLEELKTNIDTALTKQQKKMQMKNQIRDIEQRLTKQIKIEFERKKQEKLEKKMRLKQERLTDIYNFRQRQAELAEMEKNYMKNCVVTTVPISDRDRDRQCDGCCNWFY